MRTLLAVSATLVTVGLAGCTAPPEPDEAAYVEAVEALGGDLASSSTQAELVEHGTLLCDFAKDNGGDLDGAYEWIGQQLGVSATDGQAEYWSAVASAAGSHLCPDLN